MPSKIKKKKLRKILGALDPSQKGELMVQQLREDVKEGIDEIKKTISERITETKEDLFYEFNRKIQEIPNSTDEILKLRSEFNAKVMKLEDMEPEVLVMNDEELKEDLDKKLEKLNLYIRRCHS